MTRDDPNERPDLVERLPQELLGPVRHVAGVLGAAGHRAWVVGGAVRDLLYAERGRAAPVKDADLVSAALPDEVEALFPRTVAVGKSFGIVVVVVDGVEIEVATFREERGYSDRRRPDEIRFTDSLALDARRRDFTINALYLDPLDGQIEDPTGGLRDLESGRLRAVGRASDRFREDGLRILRMARFQARFALEAADGLHRAALDEADSLVGVSPERVLDELSKMVSGGGVRSAVRTLVDVGAAERVLPDWTAETAGARLRDLESLGDGPTLPGVLAALLGADGPDAARRRASLLRGSRDTVRRTGRVAELAAEIAERASAPDTGSDPEAIGALVLLAREAEFDPAARLAAARSGAPAGVSRYAARARRAAEDAPDAPVALASSDLIELGIAPGPALGAALARLTRAALGGAFDDREGALRWARAELLGG